MVEIPKKVRRDLKFVFVDRMDEVLPVALLPEVPPVRPERQVGKPGGRPS